MTKHSRSLPPPEVSDDANLLVPTLWLGAMSMVSEAESWRTANPRSAMAQLQFFFTRMFLDFRSLWAMPGFPGEKTLARSESFRQVNVTFKVSRSLVLSQKNWFLRSELCNFPLPDYWSSVRLKKKIWKKRVGQQNYRPHDILFSINF